MLFRKPIFSNKNAAEGGEFFNGILFLLGSDVSFLCVVRVFAGSHVTRTQTSISPEAVASKCEYTSGRILILPKVYGF